MIQNIFSQRAYDSSVYYKKLEDGSFVYLLLYMDDKFITAKSISQIIYLEKQLGVEFEIKE